MNDLIEKWKAERERSAFLALDDGTVFRGVAFGAKKDALGEVVFNTGMCGYQEILTDPSYAGQFVTLTTAEVGNYGVNREDRESRSLFLNGLVIGDLTAPSNYRSTSSLIDYLKKNKIPGIWGVDTRQASLSIKGFSVVGEAEVDVFLELSCFFGDPVDVGDLISGSSAFSKSSLNIWKCSVHILLKPSLENFEHYFASV